MIRCVHVFTFSRTGVLCNAAVEFCYECNTSNNELYDNMIQEFSTVF